MAGYTVSFPQLTAGSSDLDATAHELGEQLAALRAEVEALLAGGWRGRAAATFADHWQAWHVAAADAVQLLHLLAQTMAEGEGNYAATEAATASGLQRSAS